MAMRERTTPRPGVTAGRQDRLSPGGWLRTLGWRHLVGVVAVAFAVFPAI